VEAKWVPELRHHIPNVPILLVGLKGDLQHVVTREEGAALATQLKLAGYVENSALTQNNLKETFDTALLAGVQNRETRKVAKKSGWFGRGKGGGPTTCVNPPPVPPVMPEVGRCSCSFHILSTRPVRLAGLHGL
jgi:hypothetical protein